jgi:hypothetical protein
MFRNRIPQTTSNVIPDDENFGIYFVRFGQYAEMEPEQWPGDWPDIDQEICDTIATRYNALRGMDTDRIAEGMRISTLLYEVRAKLNAVLAEDFYDPNELTTTIAEITYLIGPDDQE